MRNERSGGGPGRRGRAPSATLLAALVLLGAGCEDAFRFEIALLGFAGGTSHVRVTLGSDLDPASLEAWLDGSPVGALFALGSDGLTASLSAAPGPHQLVMRVRTLPELGLLRTLTGRFDFAAPPALPALVSADPVDGASGVARSAWLRLDLVSPPDPASLASLGLACDGQPVAANVQDLGGGLVVVDPAPELPGGASCALAWTGPSGLDGLAFATAPAGPPAGVIYDRTQTASLAPYPDDFFQVDDPVSPTGRRNAIPPLDRTDVIRNLFLALSHDANPLDGWSPIGHWVIETSAPVDPASVPTTPAESLDPLASVALLDVTPGSAHLGERVPFRLDVRDDTAFGGVRGFSLLVFPSVPLEPGGRYALVVTRRALVDPGRPLDPSPFLQQVLAPPLPGEAAAVGAVRALVDPVVQHLESAAPRIAREDLALVVRVSVRSTDDIPLDLLEMKRQILANPPPALLSFTVAPDTDPASEIAAIVRGTWDAPDWRARPGGVPNPNVTRGADGLPVKQTTRPVEFVLAIPKAALFGRVPVIFHQHGNPGSQEEVVTNARRFLAGAGFAVIGFTDILNREIAPPGPSDEARIQAQVLNIFFALLQNQTIPDHWLETTAEQLAFLRFLPTLAALDVLPLGAPDGQPDLDFAAPLSYHGISEGANNGQAILPYAPELKAAALVVGGARLAEVLVHQQSQLFLDLVPVFFPGLTPTEVWTGVSLFQTIFDRQDRHNHLEFAYRRPVVVNGTTEKPSVLVIEGLDDSLVPNHATDSTAFALGLPHLAPVQRAVPFLSVAQGSLRGNLPNGLTGGYFQYVPTGVPGIPPTPGCAELVPSSASEGHYCAQGAKESRLQRVIFFQTALQPGPPEIVDPFPLFAASAGIVESAALAGP